MFSDTHLTPLPPFSGGGFIASQSIQFGDSTPFLTKLQGNAATLPQSVDSSLNTPVRGGSTGYQTAPSNLQPSKPARSPFPVLNQHFDDDDDDDEEPLLIVRVRGCAAYEAAGKYRNNFSRLNIQ